MKICPGFCVAPEIPRHISLWLIDHCIVAYPIWHKDNLSNIKYLCQDIVGITIAFAGLWLKFRCTRTSIKCEQQLLLCHTWASRVSASDICTWISPRMSDCWLGLADIQCSICHNESHRHCWQDSGGPASGRIMHFDSKYIHGCRLPAHLKFATDDWLNPFAVSFSQWNLCDWSCNRSAAGTSNLAKQFTWSHTVTNNKQEHQWNPTLAISNSRYSNSNIRTLIDFNIEERKDLSIQYSVPYKRPFWLFVSVKKIMLLGCLKRHTLMKRLTL